MNYRNYCFDYMPFGLNMHWFRIEKTIELQLRMLQFPHFQPLNNMHSKQYCYI